MQFFILQDAIEEEFLRMFLNPQQKVIFDIRNDKYQLWESCLQNFRPLEALEEEIFICGSTLSSMESWRTYLIPDWSLGDYGCQEWHLLTLRKLYTKYQAHKCSGRGDSFILKNIATDFEELDLACTRTAIGNPSISRALAPSFYSSTSSSVGK